MLQLEVITPSPLVLGRRLMSINFSVEKETETESEVTLTRKLELLVDNYWTRWKTEYLTQLREYQKIGINTRLIKEGDIVVIFSHDLKRNRWKIGKVVKLICGPDVIPRAAIVRVSSIDNKVNYVKRPVTKLYPLEINANFDVTLAEKADVPATFSDNEIGDDIIYERPTRTAADTGILIRRFTGAR